MLFHAHRVLPTAALVRSFVPGSTAVASVRTAHRVHVSCITALRRRRQGHPSNAGIDTANAARSKSKPPIEVLDPCARMRTKARMRTNARMRAGSRRRVHAERMSCGSTSRYRQYPAAPRGTLRYPAAPAQISLASSIPPSLRKNLRLGPVLFAAPRPHPHPMRTVNSTTAHHCAVRFEPTAVCALVWACYDACVRACLMRRVHAFVRR